MNKVILNKDHNDLPDYFNIKINYVTGKTDDLKVASFMFLKELMAYEFLLFEDTYKVIPITNILSLDFDKNWTNILEINRKMEKE